MHPPTGADHIVDYTKDESIVEQCVAIMEELGDGKVIDVCFDCIGDDSTAQGVEALKDGGTIVSIANWGVAAVAAAKTNGTATGKAFLVQPNADQLNEIAAFVDAGKITATKLTEMPFAEIAESHAASETGRTHGKIVLVVSAPPTPAK